MSRASSAGRRSGSKGKLPAVLTVGHDRADVIGDTHRPIQIAIDALAMRGGGTVRLGPGVYSCYDAIRLIPRVRLIGVP